jgi:hypothetical protein
MSFLLLAAMQSAPFLEKHCVDCHDADAKKGGLDLRALKADDLRAWLKVYDRVAAGEMPPKKKSTPPADEQKAFLGGLKRKLLDLEKPTLDVAGRTPLRRLTRGEYENTIRDLLSLDRIPLMDSLPGDGMSHGFDKHADALDVSHVNLAKYVEAADLALDMAIATRPEAPVKRVQRINLAKDVGHILNNGDAVLIKDGKADPEFPPAGFEGSHLDQGAHERIGSYGRGSAVGIFRHEDESFKPRFQEFSTLYPGRYRLKASFWSFHWDKGQVLPSRGTEVARLTYVHLSEDGRGGGHPSTVLGYYDAPSLSSQVHDIEVWLNYKDTIGFNTASLAPAANYSRKGRAMAFTGPAIAVDWLEVEGPIYESWPPPGHKALFGDLPFAELKPGPGAPKRKALRQEIVHSQNRPDPAPGLWSVASALPLQDADRLLAAFLPRAFRRPVPDEVRKSYVARVEERLKAGDCFELAMRSAYRAALCSPDFLYHVEPAGKLDAPALANRLAYFLWNSMPDAELAAAKSVDAQVDRLLKDKRSERFIENFLGQWLKLRAIAANDPDNKLYPEFSPYLQDSMVAETKAFFREMIEKDLDARHLVKSDFAMINQKLAAHYGISDVKGHEIRRVPLPPGCPRGPFLTQAALLKITANGTTTSPVPRGAFVMAKLLGREPDPPPSDVPAVEPDVRGTTTIREQLEKHRSNPGCAGCHQNIDPPGFALESFDVIGGFRDRYRSIGQGDPAPRGPIDPFIGISFKLGPKVDASGALPDGREFKDIVAFQELLAKDVDRLLRNLTEQLLRYAIGRDLAFADRDAVSAVMAKVKAKGGGVRSLIHEIVKSELFRTH